MGKLRQQQRQLAAGMVAQDADLAIAQVIPHFTITALIAKAQQQTGFHYGRRRGPLFE